MEFSLNAWLKGRAASRSAEHHSVFKNAFVLESSSPWVEWVEALQPEIPGKHVRPADHDHDRKPPP
jgi:hypothetical protein